MLSVALNVPTSHNAALFRALRSAGAEVDVRYHARAASTGRTWEPDLASDERLVGVAGELRLAFGALGRARRGDSSKPDVVLSGGWAQPVEATRRLLAPLGARSVHWWGERLAPTARVRSLARSAWLCAPGLDGILAVGSLAAHDYREVVNDRLPVHVFPYVTDRGLALDPAPAPEPVLGVVARLLPYKGVDLAIEALAELPAGVRLEVVGAGPERVALEALATRRRLDVRFLGPLTPDAVDQRRRTWWVQVVPNRAREGWGMAVNEALCAGVPVVATSHVAAAIDLVRRGVDGEVLQVANEAEPAAGAISAAIAPYLDAGTQAVASRNARRAGVAHAAMPAATWLLDLMRDRSSAPRSFLVEARRSLDVLHEEQKGDAEHRGGTALGADG